MALSCEVFPRLSATSEELKALGRAIPAWFAAFLRERPDVDGWLDEDAVADLLHGELPQPLAARCLRILHGITVRDLIANLADARQRHPLIHRLLPEPQARCVGFGFSLGPEARDDLLASLWNSLPLDAVLEIRVNGQRHRSRG
jgi:hypothetical protein